jgi:hypothetical protein
VKVRGGADIVWTCVHQPANRNRIAGKIFLPTIAASAMVDGVVAQLVERLVRNKIQVYSSFSLVFPDISSASITVLFQGFPMTEFSLSYLNFWAQYRSELEATTTRPGWPDHAKSIAKMPHTTRDG